MKKIFVFLLIFIALSFLYLLSKNINRAKVIPEISKTLSSKENFDKIPAISVVSKNLEVPWGIGILPDGKMLITERAGRVRIIDEKGSVSDSLTTIPVKAEGEGGLLGIAIDPDFINNKNVYLYFTYEVNNQNTFNRVVRYQFDGQNLIEEKIIVDRIPGSTIHNGGRIKFGPDGKLYITTGDARNPSLSQNTKSLAGKILRVESDGSIPRDNPFKNQIWSYGHRNPQGIAWDNQGNLWATEHGQSAHDEINKIDRGKNYGWPNIEGQEKEDGMETPIIESGNSTWAPGGAAYLDGSIFFGGLRGTALFEFKVSEQKLEKFLDGKIGRIREVNVGKDGFLYLTTSNRDGRGIPSNEDDRILRINPKKLEEL